MTKTPIRILIIDDEPLARDYLRHLLKEDEEMEIIGECGNGRDAARLIQAQKPDLIFLDVQMPEMDGFALLKTLAAETTLPAIVFTTAYEEYAIRAFEFHALDYLLKPFDQIRFNQAVAHAKDRLADLPNKNQESRQITELLADIEQKPPTLERLLIKLNGRIVFLKTSEIDWIKADDKYVHLYFGKSSYLIRQTLSAMRTLLNPQVFVQIHRSTLVNVERIRELQPMFGGEYVILMENGAKLTLSRNYKNKVFALLGKPL